MFQFWFNTYFVSETAETVKNGAVDLYCKPSDNPAYHTSTGEPSKVKRWEADAAKVSTWSLLIGQGIGPYLPHCVSSRFWLQAILITSWCNLIQSDCSIYVLYQGYYCSNRNYKLSMLTFSFNLCRCHPFIWAILWFTEPYPITASHYCE